MLNEVNIRKITSLTGHTGSVYALENAGPNSVFSGGGDKVVAEWNIEKPEEGTMLIRTPELIYSLLKIPHLDLLLVGQSAGGIHIINLQSRKEERLLQYHTASVFNLYFSPKNSLLFSLSGDGELGVIKVPSFNLESKLNVGNGKLRAVAVNNTETLLALGSGDGSIYVFSLPDMSPVKHWQAHQDGFSVNALHFSPDGKNLLSGSRDAHLNVFDAENNFDLIKSIPAHNYAIYSISYSPNRKLFATGSRDKTVKIWDAESFEFLYRIEKEKNESHIHSVNKILWHEQTGYLFTASDDRSVMVWEVMEK